MNEKVSHKFPYVSLKKQCRECRNLHYRYLYIEQCGNGNIAAGSIVFSHLKKAVRA